MSKHSRNDTGESSNKRYKRASDVTPITEDDYYEKASEFRMWLKEAKHKYFDEISSKETRRYFKKFVKKWNADELDEKYYKGVSSAQLGSSDTTRYKWSFAKKLDQFELDTVRDSVDSMTNQSRGDDKIHDDRSSNPGRRRNVGPSLPTDTYEKEEAYEREKSKRKYEAKREKERREAMLDEVAPRETGREAALAKKRALNAYHKRERSPDVELSEADLMGGDDFQARLAQEKKYQERRENRLAQQRAPILSKMDAYKAKEDATMEMFKKMAEEQKKRGGI